MAIKYDNKSVNNITYNSQTVKKLVLDNEVKWEKPFVLSESLETGCTVVYNRYSTLEPSASAGTITTADTIFNDDVLRITYTPVAGYEITSFTVNGSAYTSGADYTVHSDVAVVCETQGVAKTINVTVNTGVARIIVDYTNIYGHETSVSFTNNGSVSDAWQGTSYSWTATYDTGYEGQTSGSGTIGNTNVIAPTASLINYTITWKYLSAYPDTWATATETYHYGDIPSRSSPSTVTSGTSRKVFNAWDDLSVVTASRTITATYTHQGYYTLSLTNCARYSGDTEGWYAYGTTKTTTVKAASGWSFAGSVSQDTKSISATVPGAASASPAYFYITVQAGTGCSANVNSGFYTSSTKPASITWTPTTYYSFAAGATQTSYTNSSITSTPATYSATPANYKAANISGNYCTADKNKNTYYAAGSKITWTANENYSFGGSSTEDTVQETISAGGSFSRTPGYINISVSATRSTFKVTKSSTTYCSGKTSWTGIVPKESTVTWTADTDYSFAAGTTQDAARTATVTLGTLSYSRSADYKNITVYATHCTANVASGYRHLGDTITWTRDSASGEKWSFSSSNVDDATITATIAVSTASYSQNASNHWYYATITPATNCTANKSTGWHLANTKVTFTTTTATSSVRYSFSNTASDSYTTFDEVDSANKSINSGTVYTWYNITVYATNCTANVNSGWRLSGTTITWTIASGTNYSFAAGSTQDTTETATVNAAGTYSKSPTNYKAAAFNNSIYATATSTSYSSSAPSTSVYYPSGTTITWTAAEGYSFDGEPTTTTGPITAGGTFNAPMPTTGNVTVTATRSKFTIPGYCTTPSTSWTGAVAAGTVITWTADSDYSFAEGTTQDPTRTATVAIGTISYSKSADYKNITVTGTNCTPTISSGYRHLGDYIYWNASTGTNLKYSFNDTPSYNPTDAQRRSAGTQIVTGTSSYTNAPTYTYYNVDIAPTTGYSANPSADGYYVKNAGITFTAPANSDIKRYSFSTSDSTIHEQTKSVTGAGTLVNDTATVWMNCTFTGTHCSANRSNGWWPVGTSITWTGNTGTNYKYSMNSSPVRNPTDAQRGASGGTVTEGTTAYSATASYIYYNVTINNSDYCTGSPASGYILEDTSITWSTVTPPTNIRYSFSDIDSTVTSKSSGTVTAAGQTISAPATYIWYNVTINGTNCSANVSSGYRLNGTTITWTVTNNYYSFIAGATQDPDEKATIDGPGTYSKSATNYKAAAINNSSYATATQNTSVYYPSGTNITWTAGANYSFGGTLGDTTTTGPITAGDTFNAPNPSYISISASSTNSKFSIAYGSTTYCSDKTSWSGTVRVGSTITYTGNSGTNYRYSHSNSDSTQTTWTQTVALGTTSYSSGTPSLWYNVTSVAGTNCTAYTSTAYSTQFTTGWKLSGTTIYWKAATGYCFDQTTNVDTTTATVVAGDNDKSAAGKKKYTVTVNKAYYAISGIQSKASSATSETAYTTTVEYGGSYSYTYSKTGYDSQTASGSNITANVNTSLTLQPHQYSLSKTLSHWTGAWYTSNTYATNITWMYYGYTAYFRATPDSRYEQTVSGTRYYNGQYYTTSVTSNNGSVSLSATAITYTVSGGTATNGSVSWTNGIYGADATWTISPNYGYDAPSTSTGTKAINTSNFTVSDANATAIYSGNLGTCTAQSFTVTINRNYYAITGVQSKASSTTADTDTSITVTYNTAYSYTYSKTGYGSQTFSGKWTSSSNKPATTQTLTLSPTQYSLTWSGSNWSGAWYTSTAYSTAINWRYYGYAAYFRATPDSRYGVTISSTWYYNSKYYTTSVDTTSTSTGNVSLTAATAITYTVSGGTAGHGTVSWTNNTYGNNSTWTITANTGYTRPSTYTGTKAVTTDNFTISDANKTAVYSGNLGNCTANTYTLTINRKYYAITGAQSKASSATADTSDSITVTYDAAYSYTYSKTGYDSQTASGTWTTAGDGSTTLTLNPHQYTISQTTISNASKSINYSWVYYNRSATQIVTPDTGYDYTVSGTRYYNGNSYTRSSGAVTSNYTFGALTMNKFSYTVSGGTATNGSVSWSGGTQIGSSATWTITANAGYIRPSTYTGTKTINSTNFTLSEANKTATYNGNLGTCTRITWSMSVTMGNYVTGWRYKIDSGSWVNKTASDTITGIDYASKITIEGTSKESATGYIYGDYQGVGTFGSGAQSSNLSTTLSCTKARISGTLSQGTLPTGVASITCYRKAWDGSSYTAFTSGAVYYGDSFYWTATASTGYNNPSVTYYDASHAYTWAGSQGAAITSVSTSGLSAGSRKSFTITLAKEASHDYFDWKNGSTIVTSMTAYYGDKVTTSGATTTCYKWDAITTARWSVTATAYSNTAQYSYSTPTITGGSISSVTAAATVTGSNNRTTNQYTITWRYLSAYPDTWATATETYHYNDTPSRTSPGDVQGTGLNADKRQHYNNWDDLSNVTADRTITATYTAQGYFTIRALNCTSSKSDGWYPQGYIVFGCTADTGWSFEGSETEDTVRFTEKCPGSYRVGPTYCAITVTNPSNATANVNSGIVANGTVITFSPATYYSYNAGTTQTSTTVTVNGPSTYTASSPQYGRAQTVTLTRCTAGDDYVNKYHSIATPRTITFTSNTGYAFTNGGTTTASSSWSPGGTVSKTAGYVRVTFFNGDYHEWNATSTLWAIYNSSITRSGDSFTIVTDFRNPTVRTVSAKSTNPPYYIYSYSVNYSGNVTAARDIQIESARREPSSWISFCIVGKWLAKAPAFCSHSGVFSNEVSPDFNVNGETFDCGEGASTNNVITFQGINVINTASSNPNYGLRVSSTGWGSSHPSSEILFNDPAISGLRIASYTVKIRDASYPVNIWATYTVNSTSMVTHTVTREQAYKGLLIEITANYFAEVVDMHISFKNGDAIWHQCPTPTPDWITYYPQESITCAGYEYWWYYIPVFIKYAYDNNYKGFTMTNPYTGQVTRLYARNVQNSAFSLYYYGAGTTTLTSTPRSMYEIWGKKPAEGTLYMTGS